MPALPPHNRVHERIPTMATSLLLSPGGIACTEEDLPTLPGKAGRAASVHRLTQTGFDSRSRCLQAIFALQSSFRTVRVKVLDSAFLDERKLGVG